MKVLCAGMVRSGSTWLYNAARLTMLLNGPVQSGWHAWCKGNREDRWCLKVHEFRQELHDEADIIFTSYRDLRSVKSSWVKLTGKRIRMAQVVKTHDLWAASPKCKLDLKYEHMMNYKRRYISTIGMHLGILLTVDQIDEIYNELESMSNSRKKPHNVTLLHRRHRSNSTIHDYPEMYDRFEEWMKAHGYEK